MSSADQSLRPAVVADVRTRVTAIAQGMGWAVHPERPEGPQRGFLNTISEGTVILMEFSCSCCDRAYAAFYTVPDRVPDGPAAEMATEWFRIALVHHRESALSTSLPGAPPLAAQPARNR